MTSFRRLALASTVATLLLVAIGGLVRATKSGLGCGTDWPHCSGRLLPALENRAVIIEFSHRLMASVVVVLLAVLAVAAWRSYRHRPRIVWGSTIAFGLVLFQAALGAVVVWLELTATSVVLHLATAMTLVAVLVYVTASAWASESPDAAGSDRDTARRARAAAAAVLLLLLVGSYVSGRDAGYVFSDWPVMDGRLVPDLSFQPAAIHFLHRALAAVVGVVVAVVSFAVIRRKNELPAAARFAHAALGLFVVQVLLGAGNVWVPPPSRLNEAFASFHLLIGALIWTSLVALAAVSSPALRTAEAGSGVTVRPAYEAG
ncbi:MAG: COX15/CtaA family protein [Actinomycetota bacterium]